MFKTIKKPHFIGIGGVGMSAIAYVLNKLGMDVSGSDVAANTITDKLVSEGIKICIGHDAKHLPVGCDAIVVSSAIRKDNQELVCAQELNIPVYHRSDMLAQIMNSRCGIAVAGAHGKTTTTSMLSCVAVAAGVDPTYLIGGEVPSLGGNAHFGSSDWVIAEADESDGSFLKFYPHISIITNIENDHMDYYKSIADIEKAFLDFAMHTNADGTVILCFEDAVLRDMAKNIERKVVSYAIDEDADYQAKNIFYASTGSSYDLYFHGEFLTNVKLAVPGRHNVLNSLAVVAAGMLMGVDLEKLTQCLSTFTGAKRRFEKKGELQGILVVDDYAHHPSEIKSTLQAAKQTGKKRIVGIFQPHRYTRTQLLRKEFGECFGLCDILVLTDIYSAGELPVEGISGLTLVDEVKQNGRADVVYLETVSDVADYLDNTAREGDLVITIGAGDIYKAGEQFFAKLAAKGELS